MADNAKAVARLFVEGIRWASPDAVAELIEKAIRAERDLVLMELVELANDYSQDDPRGETYSREAMKRLLERWGHTRDE